MNPFEEEVPARRLWLTTLADLSLLLVGFFVFLQASQIDPSKLADGLRAGLGVTDVPSMPVDIAAATGFSPGSAQPGELSAVIEWARIAAIDPRTRLRITGETQGADDLDPATRSAAILAADRARAVAAALVQAHAVSADRILISTGTGQRRVLLTIGYDGERQ